MFGSVPPFRGFSKPGSLSASDLIHSSSDSLRHSSDSTNYVLPIKCKVLVVEDNVVNRRVVNLLLQKMGCEVVGACNGVEAIEAFQRAHEQHTPFDIVLMDCQMPVMDGYMATNEIRRIEAARSLAPAVVIAVTAHATNSDKQQCFEAGMNDYISKPLRKEHIINMFAKWSQGEYHHASTKS